MLLLPGILSKERNEGPQNGDCPSVPQREDAGTKLTGDLPIEKMLTNI